MIGHLTSNFLVKLAPDSPKCTIRTTIVDFSVIGSYKKLILNSKPACRSLVHGKLPPVLLESKQFLAFKFTVKAECFLSFECTYYPLQLIHLLMLTKD